jgi:hypothetical protein
MLALHLHSHGVVFSLAPGRVGNQRSIESRDLYRPQKNLSGIYFTALAAKTVHLGYTIIVAPDGTFAIRRMTVARMLGATSACACACACGDHPLEVWVVDQASMLGARDAEVLLAQPRAQRARLVLIGDVDQFGFAEAGLAFEQLQGAAMARSVWEKSSGAPTCTSRRPWRPCWTATATPRLRRSRQAEGAS